MRGIALTKRFLVSMSGCLGRLKSFLATSTPSLKRYSWIFLRSAFGMSLGWLSVFAHYQCSQRYVHCHEFQALFGESCTMRDMSRRLWLSLQQIPELCLDFSCDLIVSGLGTVRRTCHVELFVRNCHAKPHFGGQLRISNEMRDHKR